MLKEIFIFSIFIHNALILSCESPYVEIGGDLVNPRADEATTLEKYTNCFENLGCISTTEAWYDKDHRPRNFEPLDRQTIKTEFILITKNSNDRNSTSLKYDIIAARNGSTSTSVNDFVKELPLMILIHDFTSNGYTGWIKHISNILIKSTKSNLVSVDWQAGAEPPFEQAIANARVVALEICALITFLKTSLKISQLQTYIIGHGVGAHIAGYVGHSTKIERITGLDPTGPFFEFMPAVVRLDPSDALIVEVLHTDAFNSRSQGATTALGHMDFYINGAELQPNCNQSTAYPPFTKIDRNALKEGTILPACSHKRAFKYYIEALDNTECQFIGFACKNYKDFIEGKCTSCNNEQNSATCVQLGSGNCYIDSNNSQFYLKTAGEKPFCLYSYRVEIQFENNMEAKTHQTGNFEIIMVDDKGTLVTAYPTNHGVTKTFTKGEVHKFIYYAPPPTIKTVYEARLKWIHAPNPLCLFCSTAVYVEKIFITPVKLANDEGNLEKRLCAPAGKSKIESGAYITFTECQKKDDRKEEVAR